MRQKNGPIILPLRPCLKPGLARIGKSQTIKLDQLALGKRPRIWEVDRQGGGVIEGDGWILDLLHLVEHLLLARLQ